MGNSLNSTDNLIASAVNKGALSRIIALRNAAGSASTLTSGGSSTYRNPSSFIVPSVGAGLTGMYLTACNMDSGGRNGLMAALEYVLGSLTVSGNTFSSGVSMPTKTILGNSVQTASVAPYLVVASNLSSVNPTVTITYTNQDGVTGRTAVLTLTTNVIAGSAFSLIPHLQSGDTGVQAVTNISISVGTAGVLRVYGLLKLGMGSSAASGMGRMIQPLTMPSGMFLCEPGESIGFYRSGDVAAGDIYVWIAGVAEN